MQKIKKIILLYINGCEPCEEFKNIFEQVKNIDKYNGISFESYDIANDEGSKLVEKYQVHGIPTTILLDENNELIEKIIGSIEKDEFIEIINDCLNTQEGEDNDNQFIWKAKKWKG